jgi:Domain of unknown function (DUF6306)
MMHEADAAYMGFLADAELLALLNDLLEAERAGARVTLESARQATSKAVSKLMQAIHHDEARYCAMLMRQIARLGGTPSEKLGAFYEKAMAIGDLGERIIFLNRGQGWVVRKLKENVARVRDEDLRADLLEMLRVHEENIARAGEIGSGSA